MVLNGKKKPRTAFSLPLFTFFFRVCLVPAAALLIACGIDNYIYLYPVTYWINWPDTVDESRNYCAFRTSDVRNNSAAGDYFRGFEVYYRIYNNVNTLLSERAAIDSYNEDESTQAMAFDYLTSRYNYSRLTGTERLSDIPLIPSASSNRDVYIRLYDTAGAAAGIRVYDNTENGTLLDDWGIPRRTIGGISLGTNAYRFKLENIGQNDSDVRWSSTPTDPYEKTLYMQVYVVAYGYDESFTSIYSELFSLGYITLTTDYEDRTASLQ